jgi:acetyl esterase/lipase
MIDQGTCTYTKHDGVDIGLDYYLPAKANTDHKAAILLWLHGGGLVQGSRTGERTPSILTELISEISTRNHLLNAPQHHDLCVVAADYRLAPQIRFPDIMRDLVALMSFLRSEEFKERTEGRVDQGKIIVSGASAGGWLAMLIGYGIGFEECGFQAPEPPLGIVPIYPVSDMLDPFWMTKQYRMWTGGVILTASRQLLRGYRQPRHSGAVLASAGSPP